MKAVFTFFRKNENTFIFRVLFLLIKQRKKNSKLNFLTYTFKFKTLIKT